jgi:hypothetical protein
MGGISDLKLDGAKKGTPETVAKEDEWAEERKKRRQAATTGATLLHLAIIFIFSHNTNLIPAETQAKVKWRVRSHLKQILKREI